MKGSVVDDIHDMVVNEENTSKNEQGVIMERAFSNDDKEDDPSLINDGTTGVPVGITIAYRHQQKGVLDEKMLRGATGGGRVVRRWLRR